LEQKGFVFKSKTDTEVILNGYKLWGEGVFKKMKGMWALAIYDRKNSKIILSRDRFGIKPLYYSLVGKTFIFSSEIRVIKDFFVSRGEKLPLKEVGLESYFLFGFAAGSNTIFRDINKVLPGETIEFDLSKKVLTKKLMRESLSQEREGTSSNDFKDIFIRSVSDHLISDVPVGMFFSGGVDSSAIALALKHLGVKIPLVNLNIEGRHDSFYATKIADFLKMPYHEISFGEKEFASAFGLFSDNIDDCVADTAMVSSLYLSHFFRNNLGIKVVLTGEGADELFLGYPRHKALSKVNSVYKRRSLLSTWLDSFRNAGSQHGPRDLCNGLRLRMSNVVDSFVSPDYLSLYEDCFSLNNGLISPNSVDSYLRKFLRGEQKIGPSLFDLIFYLPDDLLFKTDFSTMAYSLEARTPFLYDSVFCFANSAEDRSKIGNDGLGKAPVRDFLKGEIPTELIDRQKYGMSFPVNWYLLKYYDKEVREAFAFLRSFNIPFLPNRLIEKALSDVHYFRSLFKKYPGFVFSVLVFYLANRSCAYNIVLY
jgi:asparagine synthase (glutamine-hydrolysing)